LVGRRPSHQGTPGILPRPRQNLGLRRFTHPRRPGNHLLRPSRNTAGWLQLLQHIARANRRGRVYVIADNLSSHTSGPIRRWLARHRRIQQVFIPTRACWLNMAEGWWPLLRRAAFAGQSFLDTAEITYAVQTATDQLNVHAQPWVWGRPPPPTRKLRRKFVYFL
jgi:hypothetical protein